jgi:hypothetical protein
MGLMLITHITRVSGRSFRAALFPLLLALIFNSAATLTLGQGHYGSIHVSSGVLALSCCTQASARAVIHSAFGSDDLVPCAGFLCYLSHWRAWRTPRSGVTQGQWQLRSP